MTNEKNPPKLSSYGRIEEPFKELDEYTSLSAQLFSSFVNFQLSNPEARQNLSPKLIDLCLKYPADKSFDPVKACKLLGIILSRYQENPVLLDKHIEDMVRFPIELLQTYIISHVNSQILSQDSNITHSCDSDSQSQLENLDPSLECLFNLLIEIAKVRTFKKILKFFSSDAEALEPVLYFFIQISHLSTKIKYSNVRIVLLQWLSLLANIPLQLAVIDGLAICSLPNLSQFSIFDTPFPISTTKSLAYNLVSVSLSRCFYGAGNESSAASRLFSQLIKRKDVASSYLLPSFDYLISVLEKFTNSLTIKEKPIEVYQINNILTCLSNFFDVLGLIITESNTEEISSRIDKIWILQKNIIANNSDPKNLSPVSNKLLSKTSQRISILYLQKFQINDTNQKTIESIVSFLLDTLTNSKETITRWSAVKGISKICKFSDSLEFTDNVVSYLISNLNDTIKTPNVPAPNHQITDWWEFADLSMANDSIWHGTILCLAELVRLKIIHSVATLNSTIPFLLIALKYENLRGSYLIGDNVRDAACYFAWCLARLDLSSFVQQLLESQTSPSDDGIFPAENSSSVSIDLSNLEFLISCLGKDLVSVMLFDREVHVRRAASAAFQEFVGRQKSIISSSGAVSSMPTNLSSPDKKHEKSDEIHLSFDHGISILLLADFYSVGNLHLIPEIAGKISAFQVYRQSLISHLTRKSLLQPNKLLQSIAEKSLALVISENFVTDPSLVEVLFSNVLPKLLDSSNRPELSVRVGSILGIKSLFLNSEPLALISDSFKSDTLISKSIEDVLNMPKRINPVFLKGLVGSDDMLLSLCELCKILASNSYIDFLPHLNTWISGVFFVAFTKDNHILQSQAAVLLSDIVSLYPDHFYEDREFVSQLKYNSSSGQIIAKNGFTLALGCVGCFGDVELLKSVIDTILATVIIQGNSDKPNIKDVSATPQRIELVRDAAISLGNLIYNFSVNQEIPQDILITNIGVLLEYGLSNYRTDHRGDVGSWVRLACMSSLCQIVDSNKKLFESPNTTATFELLAAKTLEMCISLQSNLRSQAGKLLNSLLLSNPIILNRLFKESLENDPISMNLYLSISDIGSMLYSEYPRLDPPIEYISTGKVFNEFIKILELKTLPRAIAKFLMRGVVSAVGNISETVSQAASSAILSTLRSFETCTMDDETDTIQGSCMERPDYKNRLLEIFVELFRESMSVKAADYSRINIACTRTVDLFINEDIFTDSKM
ncbi:Tubulin-specific chaperone D [Smittium mucronatum]|uniref:Tubulin-specific chaperone D n=1 Tax=Smittium mucronatum TaxID=133383 RepID=A0A1R0GVI1_9FUNG|nr:Tubulin-specific chaperone D [Smittium mucronatum]